MTAIEKRVIRAGSPTFSGMEAQYVADVLEKEWLTQGEYVAQFERGFAEQIGVKHAISVCNGTAALHLALLAAGVGPGAEVIVPALTFIATVNAVKYCGATPIFVDVDPLTWCMDVNRVREHITVRTRAILPVHLYGAMADMQRLQAVAGKIPIIEDAAEALLAHDGVGYAGSRGLIGAFSFYGNKTITTGEGGMVVTNDDPIADKIRLMRGQGQAPGRRYWHEVVGFNYRMTDLQAAIGCGQMAHLGQIIARRAEVAARYREMLADMVEFQTVLNGHTHGNWAVAVLLPMFLTQEDAMRELAERGIETRPVFPLICDMPPYYTMVRLPNSRMVSRQGIVLPTHAGLSDEDVDAVCQALREVVYG